MAENDVSDPAVRALIAAINHGDRNAFFAHAHPGCDECPTTAPTAT